MKTSRAGAIFSLDTLEFDEFNQLTAGWSVEHHPLGAMACQSRLYIVQTPALQVGRVQHSSGYTSQGENPARMLTLVLPLDEARPMVHRGHGIGPMEMGLTRSGESYEVVCRSGVHFVAGSVARERAESYAADVWQEPGFWSDRSDRLQFQDSVHRSRYLDVCERILVAVSEQPGLLVDQRAAALLEEKFLEGVFLNAHIARPCVNERRRYDLARLGYRYLQDRADEVPSIRGVCAFAGASYATLERAFRETYGMTPKTIMVAMRLARTRRQLLHPGPSTTVTAVALRWGFVEFGRFAAQYRRRYGELPRETLHRAHAGPRG